MAGFNISSFFNNSKGDFGSINFSDYSLIRSGSYQCMAQHLLMRM